MYLCMYACMYVSMYVLCMYVCMCVCMCVCMSVCMHVCIVVCVYTCMCVCVCVCVRERERVCVCDVMNACTVTKHLEVCNSHMLIVQDLGQARPRLVLVRLDLATAFPPPLRHSFPGHDSATAGNAASLPSPPRQHKRSQGRTGAPCRALPAHTLSRSSCCWRVSCRGILPVSL